jgi:hypothetical protein
LRSSVCAPDANAPNARSEKNASALPTLVVISLMTAVPLYVDLDTEAVEAHAARRNATLAR